MRNAFAAELEALGRERDDIVLLSGDIGNRMFDRFKQENDDRFFNCGVAEANMIGVAAGMAMSGLRPVVYTIVPFVTARCLEQIRVDVCYHRQPVVIVGVGGGLAYANLGATHHACEDIAMMRSLPGMQVVCPADPLETRAALRAAVASPSPTYLRIGKKGEPTLYADALDDFAIGSAIARSDPGADVTLLACGAVLSTVEQAAAVLRAEGLDCGVASVPTVKPLDESFLNRVFAASRIVCTVEEHSRIGGFGAAVAEWFADQPDRPRASLLRIATPDAFFRRTGSPQFARQQLGLTPEGVCAQVRETLRGSSGKNA